MSKWNRCREVLKSTGGPCDMLSASKTLQKHSALPHNLMCIPLTGQAVSRKVEQPANLAKREER
jgi:hypothetical protein